jgi:hypothetical protein
MQVRPSGPDTDDHQQKRRPGRPRGSKNRPRPSTSDASQKQQAQLQPHPSAPPLFYTYKPTPQNQVPSLPATAPVSAPPPPPPPQHPDVNAHNQQYYEFQWRVLNLCAEFYGAAEELVVSRVNVRIRSSFDITTESNSTPRSRAMLPYGSDEQD